VRLPVRSIETAPAGGGGRDVKRLDFAIGKRRCVVFLVPRGGVQERRVAILLKKPERNRRTRRLWGGTIANY